MHYACWCSRPNIYVHNVQEMKRKKLDKCFSDYFPHFIFLSHPILCSRLVFLLSVCGVKLTFEAENTSLGSRESTAKHCTSQTFVESAKRRLWLFIYILIKVNFSSKKSILKVCLTLTTSSLTPWGSIEGCASLRFQCGCGFSFVHREWCGYLDILMNQNLIMNK